MSTSLLKTLTRSCFQNLKKHTQHTRLESTNTYRAALVREALKGLSVETKKSSKLHDYEVRLQVSHCSVNSGDLLTFKDESKQLPFVPGYELSGEVIEVGKKVTNEQILLGEKVAALSLEKFGGFADECVLSINDIFRLPSNVHPKDAAVLTSGHGTALLAFSEMRKLKENEYVLVTAGAAGLGLAAVDVAANVYKAKVIGVVDSSEKADLLRERGAFQTLQFGSKIRKHVLAATENKGANVVYDAVGEHMLESIGKCAAYQGNIFHVAPSTHKTIPAPLPNRNVMILNLLELRQHNVELYRNIISSTLELADEAVITAHISAQFDLTNINDAIHYVQEKKCTGKVLIKMNT